MNCQRCLADEARYRVYSDAIDIRVCTSCAEEARELEIAVEILPNIADPIIGLGIPNQRVQ
ncbi:MAG: hypothetical protein ACE5JU_05755 [Candidatus Binatia bacterium]